MNRTQKDPIQTTWSEWFWLEADRGRAEWQIIVVLETAGMSSVRDIRFDHDEPASFRNDVFDDFIELYLSKLETFSVDDSSQRCLLAILGSPESMAARAIVRNANILRLANVNIRVIFGRVSPFELAAQWFDSRGNFRVADSRDHFRWVKNHSLLDAHEQVVLGTSMCWSGDSMRRQPNQRDSFELFEDSSPAMARLGRLAFEALWDASANVPCGKLRIIEKILSGSDVSMAEMEAAEDGGGIYDPKQGRVCH